MMTYEWSLCSNPSFRAGDKVLSHGVLCVSQIPSQVSRYRSTTMECKSVGQLGSIQQEMLNPSVGTRQLFYIN